MLVFCSIIVLAVSLSTKSHQLDCSICGVYKREMASADKYHIAKKQLLLNQDYTYEYYSNYSLLKTEFSDGNWSMLDDENIILQSKVQDFDKLSLVVSEKFQPDIEGIYIELSTSNGKKIPGTVIFNRIEKYACGVNYIPDSDACLFNNQGVQLKELYVDYYNYTTEPYMIKNPISNHFEITVDGPVIFKGYLIWKYEKAQLVAPDKIVVDNDTLIKIQP